MQVMQFPLVVLTVAGCWLPISWSSLSQRMIYNVYTVIITLLLFTFMLPQIVDIIVNADNADEFTETFFVTLPIIMGFFKMLGLLLNRNNIEKLTGTLVEKPFVPLEPDEIKIRQKFDDTIQFYAKLYTFMIEITCTLMNIATLFTSFRKGKLAYREWLPYEYSTGLIFYFTYFRQLISLTVASIVNVACDCMVCGLLLHICCQIEILKCRLRKCLRNQSNLRECVIQHEQIYKLVFQKKFLYV